MTTTTLPTLDAIPENKYELLNPFKRNLYSEVLSLPIAMTPKCKPSSYRTNYHATPNHISLPNIRQHKARVEAINEDPKLELIVVA
jgi:hypothetical protein